MEIQYIIKPDNQIYRRQVIADERIDILPQIMDQLTRDSMAVFHSIFELPEYGKIHAVRHQGMTFFTLKPSRILIDAHYVMNNGYLVPVFKGATGASRMRLAWTPPAGMWLNMLISSTDAYAHSKTWLFATDGEFRTYRVPIANLFEDCGVCLGKFDGYREDALAFVKHVIQQYETAPYNADLAYYENQTIRMFRWLPKGTGFEVVAPTENWTTLCQLVSADVTKYLRL